MNRILLTGIASLTCGKENRIMPSKTYSSAPPGDPDERLSVYPLSFEEALQSALAVDPRKVGTEDGGDDGDAV
jgi:hypothetical protein